MPAVSFCLEWQSFFLLNDSCSFFVYFLLFFPTLYSISQPVQEFPSMVLITFVRSFLVMKLHWITVLFLSSLWIRESWYLTLAVMIGVTGTGQLNYRPRGSQVLYMNSVPNWELKLDYWHVLVSRHGILIGIWDYWALINRNYKYHNAVTNSRTLLLTTAHAYSLRLQLSFLDNGFQQCRLSTYPWHQ